MKRLALGVLAFALLAIGGLWLYSHVSPDSFGSCRQVALSIGTKPTIKECQAYGTSDFLLPLAIVTVLLIVFSGEGVITLTIPFLGELKKTPTPKEQKAVKIVEEQVDLHLLDRQAKPYLGSVRPGGAKEEPNKDL